MGDLRNVTVEGDILPVISSREATLLQLPVGTVGGVYLPLDNIGSVATWGNLPAGVIRSTGIEGIAFSTLTDTSGNSHTASSLTNESSEDTLLQALAYNSSSHKYYESVNLPTETLRVVFSNSAMVALFVDGTEGNDDWWTNTGTQNNGDFEEQGLQFTDEAATDSLPTNQAITAIRLLRVRHQLEESVLGDSTGIRRRRRVGGFLGRHSEHHQHGPAGRSMA